MARQLAGAFALTVLAAACTMSPAPDARLYAALDDADARSAATTVQRTLETAPDGEARNWRNPTSGHGGSIRPVATYVSEAGQFCRRYDETLLLGDEEGSWRHDACREADGYGVWQ